jgi:hypothetical protein
MTTFRRLSSDKTYKRPETTFQDTLSKEEIEEKLKDYIKVDDINKVALNTHIRYFVVDENTKEKSFRLGGFLMNKDKSDKYIVLKNGSQSWSVQVANSIFYKKKNVDDVKAEYESMIQLLENKIKKYKSENKELKQLINNIKCHEIDKIKKKKS